jgi:hypothetical protein
MSGVNIGVYPLTETEEQAYYNLQVINDNLELIQASSEAIDVQLPIVIANNDTVTGANLLTTQLIADAEAEIAISGKIKRVAGQINVEKNIYYLTPYSDATLPAGTYLLYVNVNFMNNMSQNSFDPAIEYVQIGLATNGVLNPTDVYYYYPQTIEVAPSPSFRFDMAVCGNLCIPIVQAGAGNPLSQVYFYWNPKLLSPLVEDYSIVDFTISYIRIG